MAFLGPGLAIRVLCGDEPYIGKDFPETNIILKFMVEYAKVMKTVSVISSCRGHVIFSPIRLP